MKVFFSTLAAILVAAVIIWFVASAYHANEASVKLREETRGILLEGELSNAQTEWEQKVGPRLDPNAEQLVARLRQIREASEAGKPIPPSPWKADSKPEQAANKSKEPQVNLLTPPPEYVTLNRDVEVSHGTKKVTIPKGSNLLVVSRGSGIVGVRFENEFEIIPESATSKSK